MTGSPIVRALHHVALRTADADEAAGRWKDLWSLRDAPGPGGVRRLRCATEPYGIELISAAEPGHDHTAFELQQGLALGDAAARLDGLGIAYERTAESLRLADPEGFGVELLPYAEPADRRPYVAQTGGDALAGAPRRVGHANMLVADAKTVSAFYADALGMRIPSITGQTRIPPSPMLS